MRRSTRIWLSFRIHRFLSSLVSALSQFLYVKRGIHRLLIHYRTDIPLRILLGLHTISASSHSSDSWNITGYRSQIVLFMYWGESYFVTHMVFLHWLTRVSLSSSRCGLTVISSKVLGRAQNSRLAGSTFRLTQLAKLIRPIGFYKTVHIFNNLSDLSNI